MTMIERLRTVALTALAPALLAGCVMSDGLYGGVSVGAGDYYSAGYDPYGYYGHSYGWYDNYYYPGTGTYVYDRAGRAHRMRAQDQAYWQARREARADRRYDRLERREDRLERREARRQDRFERRGDRTADPAAVQRREARRSEGLFNREARQVVRQAARGRERGEASAEQQP